MATYVIGDVQGCYQALQALLDVIQFDPKQDTLWFTGDLINRGPQSLETLRFIKSLGDKQRVILGNHDLHFLACAHGAHAGWEEDTFRDILNAKDRDELVAWLQQQPLAFYDENTKYLMVHAGLAFNWDLSTALRLAKEVEAVIQSNQATEFFKNMYGNQPDRWDEKLQGWDRLRCITNFFTRVRFCHADGRLELENKGTLHKRPEHLLPWFQLENRQNKDIKILFGHWAALGGETHTVNAYALDTGCVWGYSLTAMRLEDEKRFQVSCAISK